MKKWLKRIGVVLVVLLLLAAYGQYLFYKDAQEAAKAQPTQQVAPVVEQQPPTVEGLLRLVNEERAKVGVKPLRLNKDMATTAQWKADDMYKRDYFSHWPDTLDGVKNTEKYTVNLAMRRLLAANCVESSENISWANKGANTSNSAMIGWMNSKPHREALQDNRYESTGIGISGNKIVQHFCDEQ